jgi:Uncharacterized conserved protein related to C-terminal domain of eukaryotic chaperone, SACSIN
MKQYLKLAREDLEAAQLLYEGKKYSNALYHYHQSVEKASKSIGLAIGGVSEKQLTDISHEPIKVFKLLFTYFWKQSDDRLPKPDFHMFTNAKQVICSGSEEEAVRSARNMLKSIGDEGKIINEELFPTPFDAVIDHIGRAMPDVNLGLDSESLKHYVAMRLKDEVLNTILLVNRGMKILQILMINSLVCCKFKPDQFRYPTNSLGSPIEYFNENNPLVRDLHFFMNSMKIPFEFAPKIKWGQNSLLST